MFAKHLANVASSADTTRRMVIALEKSAMEKDTEILSLKESVKSSGEKLKIMSEQESKLSAKLKTVESEIVELKKKLEESHKFKDLAGKSANDVIKIKARVAHYNSVEYTEEVINIFQQSTDYQTDLFNKASVYYERGMAHILR